MQPSRPAVDPDVGELTARLLRYPQQHYPVQHAVTQFHLGVALLRVGRAGAALDALTGAEAAFRGIGLSLELAKAGNMRGVALRETGDLQGAAQSFAAAATDFARLDQPLEEAAASYNAGLTRRLLGDPDGAEAALARAGELFAAANLPVQEAAVGRERGTLLLTAGRLEEAAAVLGAAVDRARDGGDATGAGAGANALGLAHLAAGRPSEAVEAFRAAVALHPLSLRPTEHAMAKANLALAYERQALPAHARLAAVQALAATAVPGPVRQQAREILDRLPAETGAELFEVLAAEPAQRRDVLLREEVTRWAACSPALRSAAAGHWVAGVVQRAGSGPELSEGLLNALLELPPAAYERVVAAVVSAAERRPAGEADRFRAVTRSGMARFPVPQWQRLAATFERAAAGTGASSGWT